MSQSKNPTGEAGLTAKRSNRAKPGLIVVIIILTVALAALAMIYYLQHQQMAEMVEQMEFEKEQIEEEYSELALQFDGYRTMDIQNDSLQEQLSREQQRVQDLLEELRITKATSARRIAELKKELATVRAVMVQYVHQIDSLHSTNVRLTEENVAYKKQNKVITQENEQIKQTNTELQQVVTRASMLELTSCEVTTLNKWDHKTRLISQITKLQVDYAIGKNVTCEVGMKQLYLRLVDPNGDLLQPDTTMVFDFENQQIGYSVVQEFEYERQAFNSTLYYRFADRPIPGYYNADFFVDGNLIGSYPFELKK